MKVLIIGGTGLIRTAITSQLVEQGHAVTRYNRGKTEVRVPWMVDTILGNRQSFAEFEKQMAKHDPFDCVIDMVCFTPEEAQSAVRAFKGRAGHFIFCSTVDVYSRPTQHFPIHEDEPRGGVSSYGKRKAQCELIFQ